MNREAAEKIAQEYADTHDTDVLFFSGDIGPNAGRQLMDAVCPRNRRDRVTMFLVTPGGDPDAAFKMGRALQNSYEHITIVVSGWCKSAGTLVAIAANNLIIGDRGELGPLDIQLAKADEIMELGSGLGVDSALKTLETTASRMFLNLMVQIRRDTGGAITTRTAAELSTRMVIGLLQPVYQQIDPIKVGENSRAMNITKGYGTRLNMVANNLRSTQSLDWLVSLYPDHSFVIDRREAKLLFTSVEEPNDLLTSLIDAMGEAALSPRSQGAAKGLPTIEYLSTELSDGTRSEEADAAPRRSKPARAPKRARGNGRAAPTNGARVE